MELPAAFRSLRGLRQSSNGYFALCPFHPDRNPSLHISRVGDRWLWYCFGCGAGGDEADLARRLGLRVDHAGEADRSENWLRVLEKAWAQWESPDALAGRLYMRMRGVSEEAQEAFRIGWVPEHGIAFPMRQLVNRLCGIKIRRLDSRRRYSALRGSREGVVAPWEPRMAPVIVAVEGTIDALAIFEDVRRLGAEVASCKSPELLSRFFPGFQKIVVWMDEDEAGKKFGEKFRERFGEAVRFVRPTGFKDPAALAEAARRGEAPFPYEILQEAIGTPRAPAWMALWEAAARRGWIEPPPVRVDEADVQQAQKVLQLLPKDVILQRLRRMIQS